MKTEKVLVRRVPIYLAWQKISDGRLQIRRYSPNAKASEIKLFEPSSKAAITWLSENNNPQYPDCTPPLKPYQVVYIGQETRGTV